MKSKKPEQKTPSEPRKRAENKLKSKITPPKVISEIKEAEEALGRYRLLAESSRDIILFIRYSDGRILEANRAAVETYGYTLDELLSLNISALRFPEEQAIVASQMSQANDTGILFEARHMRKDGSVITVEVSSRGATMNGERILLSIIRDITERKRAEEALREREEKMQSIFRVAPTGIGVVKDRILLDVNPRVCEMTGYAKEELVGKSSRIFYPTQEDFEYVGTEKYRQIAERGTGVVETRWMKKDGTIFDVLLASTPIDLNDLSKGVTFTALDISERKRAEDTIRMEKQFTETLLESLPGLFYLYEFDIQSPANSRLIRFNRKHSTLTGYTPEELQGMKIKDWFEPDVLEEAVSAISIIGERGEAQANLKLRMKDGSQVPYAFTGRLLNIDDKMYFLGVGIDISDFVRAQEALKESEEKYRLVVENANDAIFIVQNERIKFPNRQTMSHYRIYRR